MARGSACLDSRRFDSGLGRFKNRGICMNQYDTRLKKEWEEMRQHAADMHRKFIKAQAQADMWKAEFEAIKKLCEEVKAERDNVAMAFAMFRQQSKK